MICFTRANSSAHIEASFVALTKTAVEMMGSSASSCVLKVASAPLTRATLPAAERPDVAACCCTFLKASVTSRTPSAESRTRTSGTLVAMSLLAQNQGYLRLFESLFHMGHEQRPQQHLMAVLFKGYQPILVLHLVEQFVQRPSLVDPYGALGVVLRDDKQVVGELSEPLPVFLYLA
jgi:hypothetical protein